jgi:methyl-accepting chemotaxis protein
MRLNKRLSLILGIFTVISFIVLNLVVNAMFGAVINKTSNRSMTDISTKNVGEMNLITERNEVLVRPLVNSLIEMHKTVDENDELYPSVVLDDTMLVESRCDREIVILSTLKAIVDSNEYIEGAGVFFNPKMFQKNIDEYEVYCTKEDAENNTTRLMKYDDIKDKEYFTASGADNKVIYAIPVTSELTGNRIIPAAFPIVSDGDFLGIVRVDIDTRIFDHMVETSCDAYKSITIEIDSGNQYVVYSNNESAVGKQFSDLLPAASVEFYKEKFEAGEPFMRENTGVRRFYSPVQVGEYTWWVQTAVTVEELMHEQKTVMVIMSAIQIAALLVLIGLLSYALRRSLKPLTNMAEVAKGISHGKLNARFEYPYNDEIGELADDMQYMAERFRKIINDLDTQLAELANGNLVHDAYDKNLYEGDFESLHTSVENIKKQLNGTLVDIRNVAASVDSGAEQVSAGAQILAQGATEQAASVEELNAEMSRIHDGVRNTTKMTTDASELSRDGNTAVRMSNDKMQELTEAMADITEKSNEISKIIKTIDDIAFQTNILALNAAVEAARAGDTGKGFAVVADEVRNLAGKSAEAAKSTAELIQDALNAISNGEKITAETASALQKAAANTEQITVLVENIAQTMNEQATAVDTVSEGLDQIASVVQTNSATAEESAASSEELSSQATELDDLIGRFRLKD